jgi:hypothetical protein
MYPQESQMDALANQIRRVGGVPTKQPASDPKKYTRATPDIGRIHNAVRGGHITVEEAVDLNPKYDPAKKNYNNIQSYKINARDRDPSGERAKNLAQQKKRKARLKDG